MRHLGVVSLVTLVLVASGCEGNPIESITVGSIGPGSESGEATGTSSSSESSTSEASSESESSSGPRADTSSESGTVDSSTGEPREPVNALWHFDGIAEGAGWPAPWVATLSPASVSVSDEQGQVVIDNGIARIQTSGDTSSNDVLGFTGTMEGLDEVNTFEAQLDVVAPLLSSGSQNVIFMARVMDDASQGLGVRLHTGDSEIQIFDFATGGILASAPLEFIVNGNPIGHFQIRLSLSTGGILTGAAIPYIKGTLQESAMVLVDSDVSGLVAGYQDGGSFAIDVQSTPPSPMRFDNIQIIETSIEK